MSHVARDRANRRACLFLAACLTLGSVRCFHPVGTAGSETSAITEAEIDSVHAASAYDAVRKLRPLFLTVRGKMSVDPQQPAAQPNVYVDNMYYGDISTLRTIEASMIESIKFYSASEAQYAFGRGNMAGVIAILTKH
ncbi:MAG TPA: Plug domain-containing protein [Gemmatimonadaceae bacterium]|nr:Plug domain-containing protein [Gemmatimonadaceae bacterium]